MNTARVVPMTKERAMELFYRIAKHKYNEFTQDHPSQLEEVVMLERMKADFAKIGISESEVEVLHEFFKKDLS